MYADDTRNACCVSYTESPYNDQDQSEGFLKALQREGDLQAAASKGQLRVASNWSCREKKQLE